MDAHRLTEIAAALGVETRAHVVCALMSGTAHTATELGHDLDVAASTMSEHLGRLVDAGLVAVEAQGRHRYYRLAGPEIADVIEQLIAVVPVVPRLTMPRVPEGVRFARSCYDHLAGELGVRVCARLIELGAVAVDGGDASLTGAGRELLCGLGADPAAGTHRPVARLCIDWSHRRHHLAGTTGAALLTMMLREGWLRRHPQRHRELRLTNAGRRELAARLDLEV